MNNKKIDSLIRKQLFSAWEAGKKQKDTPNKYTLDTDKLGQPIYNFIHSALEEQRKEAYTKGCFDQLNRKVKIEDTNY